MLHRALAFLVLLPSVGALHAQPVIGDSTYLRMPDRAKALEAMRFDMDAYRDTLRTYRDAVEATVTAIDASGTQGQEKRARLGRIREDVKTLEKEMKRQRKRMKKTAPPFEESARSCSDLVRRTKLLRSQLIAEGARPER
jgi:phage-related tail protein